jgi:2-amino-4-hydroxy-6-hydroxymethyldihydropteridine diphosphokinase
MTSSVTRVAIALGSNLQNRYELLQSAARAIAAVDGVAVVTETAVEETDAFGPPQPAYLNQMLLVETRLALPMLLSALQDIEAQHGRSRAAAKGPRTLDLDIVWAEGVTVTSLELLVPHPGLTNRAFWQRELAELLGVEMATEAITVAAVHAGLDTAESDQAKHERRWSGSWDTVA